MTTTDAALLHGRTAATTSAPALSIADPPAHGR